MTRTPRRYDRAEIADVVLEAMKADLPVVATLREVFDVDHRTAEYMLRAARENGHLGFGLHRPARAVIHRGTPREKRWIVCEHCITHWPCAHGRAELAARMLETGEGPR